MKNRLLAAFAAMLFVLPSWAIESPDHATATSVVERYLADHGDLCLGKMNWPIDLSALDERARGWDAVQLPVLASLGLVTSHLTTAPRIEGPGLDDDAAPVPIVVRRYELTALGEAAMRPRDIVAPGPAGDRIVHVRDLCVAHLRLDAVTDWQADGAASTTAAPDAVATYTYRLTAAPWAAEPAFRQVFPLIARVVDGEGSMTLKQRFKWVHGAWAPAGLAD
jgi:hypothetical protein